MCFVGTLDWNFYGFENVDFFFSFCDLKSCKK